MIFLAQSESVVGPVANQQGHMKMCRMRVVFWKSKLAAFAAFAVFLCLSIDDSALAAESAASEQSRPKIGLVLAGGGAKGIAHVGVLKVLEEAGVTVDLIVGTSMGAIVGGVYAMGHSASELEEIILTIDWENIFVDDTPRRELTIRRKIDDFGFLAKPKLRLKDGKVRLPLGAINGQRLELELKRLTRAAVGINEFDKLPIPFRAVAADLETGEEVIIDHGELAVALRSSMSVPGVFPPVEFEGRLLVDGGVVNNIPVSVARAMGADIVIVSTFVEKLGPAKDLGSLVAILNRSIDIMTLAGRRQQLASLGPDDVLIVSDLGEIGAASFERAAEGIAPGEEAAREHFDRLAELASPEPRALEPLISDLESRPIRRIVIEHDTPLSEDVLRARMRTRESDPLDTAKLEQDMARIYGLKLFETVTYSVEEADDGVAIRIVAKEHSAGKDFLRFGLELLTDVDREADYNVGVSYTVPALNELNGEWRSQAVLGKRLGLATQLYQPLDPAARFFVTPGVSVLDRDVDIFEDRKKIAETRVIDARAILRAGSNLSDDLAVFGEVSRGIGRVREVTGSDLVEEKNFDTASLGLGFDYDDIDDLRFPREGAIILGRYDWSLEDLGADEEFQTLRLKAQVANSWGTHTLVLGQSADLTVDGGLDTANLFRLGGPFRLSGLLRGALTGDNMLLSRAVYYNEIDRFGPAFLDTPLYLGGSLEYGNVFEDTDDIKIDDMLVGTSLFLGADTYLGPMYLGYGYTEGGSHALFLLVGGLF